MACPFSRFARLTGFSEASSSPASTSSLTPLSMPLLTTRLKDGTSEAHREIERSAGVRALMGSFHSHSQSTITFNRVDHFRFLVMLACVYITMEATLVERENALSDMLSLLVRSKALLNDVQVHLDEILESTDAKPYDVGNTVEEGSEAFHKSIFERVIAAQQVLASHKLLGVEASPLTFHHIALLTKRQAKAVMRYTEKIAGIGSTRHYDEGISFTPVATPSSSSSLAVTSYWKSTSSPSTDLILAHAYVRYMGDLSGGQHIVKRLSKLFPIYHKSNTGFEFYSFTSTNKTNTELKDMIRSRMDGEQLQEKDIVMIVDEASEAFRLNRGLLDSLVDEAELGIDTTETSSKVSPHMKLFPLLPYHPRSLTLVAILLALASAVALRNVLS